MGPRHLSKARPSQCCLNRNDASADDSHRRNATRRTGERGLKIGPVRERRRHPGCKSSAGQYRALEHSDLSCARSRSNATTDGACIFLNSGERIGMTMISAPCAQECSAVRSSAIQLWGGVVASRRLLAELQMRVRAYGARCLSMLGKLVAARPRPLAIGPCSEPIFKLTFRFRCRV